MIKFLLVAVQSFLSRKPAIAHCHFLRIPINLLIVRICRICRIDYVQTFHSFRVDLQALSPGRVRQLKTVLALSKSIIAVNHDIKNKIVDLLPECESKIYVLPAYIPSSKQYSETELSQHQVHLGLKDFVLAHDTLILANAFKIIFYNDEDLYGVDLSIELMRNLYNDPSMSSKRKIGLIFMMPQIGEEEYLATMKARVDEYGVSDHVVFVHQQAEMIPMFHYVDIFIRPTNTDGDANSVREALDAGLPTIASDVVARPGSTILFKNRDADDLTAKVMDTLNNLEACKQAIQENSVTSQSLLSQYEMVYDHPSS